MFKQVMTALFALSLVAMFWTEANAATCLKWSTIGGTKTCLLWSTGSEVCNAVSTGVGNPKCDPALETCPAITCAAFGTVPLANNVDCTNNFDPDNTDCGIKGIAFCRNPASKSSKAQGQPFTLDTVLTETQNIDTCDRNGRCVNTIELDPQDCPDCCINPNWQFITFTASEFNAELVICPGGYDVNNEFCCADSSRTTDNKCDPVPPTATTNEITLAQRCTVDLTNYKPRYAIPYNGQPL